MHISTVTHHTSLNKIKNQVFYYDYLNTQTNYIQTFYEVTKEIGITNTDDKIVTDYFETGEATKKDATEKTDIPALSVSTLPEVHQQG